MSIPQQSLTEINNMINKDNVFPETRRLVTLKVGQAYMIKKLVYLATRYGKKLVATLCASADDAIFQTFLPNRVSEALTAENVEIMNSSSGKYTLTYLGRDTNNESSKTIARAIINFGYLE